MNYFKVYCENDKKETYEVQLEIVSDSDTITIGEAKDILAMIGKQKPNYKVVKVECNTEEQKELQRLFVKLGL